LVKSAYYQIFLVMVFYFTKNLLIDWYDSVFSYLAVIPVILLMIKYLKNKKVAYFGDIRTLIPGVSGQHIGIIRTEYRKHPDTLSS